jgi:hypothetical protein
MIPYFRNIGVLHNAIIARYPRLVKSRDWIQAWKFRFSPCFSDRIQDAGLSGADDRTVLEWVAREHRILLTHDVTAITFYAPPASNSFDTLRWGPIFAAPARANEKDTIDFAIGSQLMLYLSAQPGLAE